ncbi:hypothetical protein F4826_003541 [Rahnella inusitata]|nr:hypothetical protein [Rahnella inusitata]
MIFAKKMIFMIILTPVISHASLYYNQVKVDKNNFFLDKINHDVMHITNNDKKHTCLIENWESKFSQGAGVISRTTDGKAIVLANTDSYLYVNELVNCQNNKVLLHKVPVPFSIPLGVVVDMNFDKKIYLLMILEDVQSRTYTALVSNFNTKKNIISADGFFSESSYSENGFNLGNEYSGRISLDGRYIYPESLGCSIDSFPGVWDIINKGRVIFRSSKNSDADIKSKCQILFSGKASLKELGGELLPDKN